MSTPGEPFINLSGDDEDDVNLVVMSQMLDVRATVVDQARRTLAALYSWCGPEDVLRLIDEVTSGLGDDRFDAACRASGHVPSDRHHQVPGEVRQRAGIPGVVLYLSHDVTVCRRCRLTLTRSRVDAVELSAEGEVASETQVTPWVMLPTLHAEAQHWARIGEDD